MNAPIFISNNYIKESFDLDILPDIYTSLIEKLKEKNILFDYGSTINDKFIFAIRFKDVIIEIDYNTLTSTLYRETNIKSYSIKHLFKKNSTGKWYNITLLNNNEDILVQYFKANSGKFQDYLDNVFSNLNQ